jgi:hypothetical protein
VPGCPFESLHHRVFRVGGVPLGHQVFGGLAHVLAELEAAAEGAVRVQGVVEGRVGAVAHVQRAVQAHAGGVGAQAVDLDGAPGAVEEDDRIAQLLDDQVHRAFVQAGAVRQVAVEFGLLHGVAQLDARAEGVDCDKSVCHF